MKRTADITLYLRELVGNHLRWDNANGALLVGVEAGLIDQLEECIPSTRGSRSGGGSSQKTTAPVDLAAVDLHQSISEDVNFFLPAWHRRGLLKDRVLRFGTDAVADERILMEQLGKWYRAIRKYLDPLPQRPLPGVSCPKCLEARLPRIMDGERVYVPVITVYPEQLMATCTNCGQTWHGEKDLRTLARVQVAQSPDDA